MLYVGLAYEYSIENRFDEAFKKLEVGDYLVEELMKKSSESHHMALALQHIIMSSKVYLLLWKEDLRTALTVRSFHRSQSFLTYTYISYTFT